MPLQVLHSTGVPVASADVPSESLWENIAPQAGTAMDSSSMNSRKATKEMDQIRSACSNLDTVGSEFHFDILIAQVEIWTIHSTCLQSMH